MLGKVNVKVQRLKANTGKGKQVYYDALLDESGWSPEALKRLLELSSRLPYEESSQLAKLFGLDISGSGLESVTSSYAESCRQALRTWLEARFQATKQPAQPASAGSLSGAQETGIQGRVMVLQLDGVQVLGRPEQGTCSGMEIKSAVLYPQSSPRDRWRLADRCSATDFLALLPGLLEAANVSPKDTLIGLGDGAGWVENSFEYLQAKHITDVYHATDYLDTVMQALSWDEDARTRHRCTWYRGEVNARDWLQQYLPAPELWLSWQTPKQP